MDWATQPRPFREFPGSPPFPLFPGPGVVPGGYNPPRTTFERRAWRVVSAGPNAGSREQREGGTAWKLSKGPGLSCPVHVPESPGEAMEMMFRSVVVRVHASEGIPGGFMTA